MEDHYKTLGVNSSATADEIRRAYRVLARRYHPDVNPGRASEERFKAIASAYAVLSDGEARRRYDAEYDGGRRPEAENIRRYKQAQSATERFYEYQAKLRSQREQYASQSKKGDSGPSESARRASAPKADVGADLGHIFSRVREKLSSALPRRRTGSPKDRRPSHTGTRVSIIEVSVTAHDAIAGVKKTVEINEPEGLRKVSVNIPPGVRNGSVLRLRSKSAQSEDLVIVVRVASHPSISIQPKGLIVEIPVTVNEAILGTTITLPTLDDPVLVKIPAGTQSGQEIRLRERGITNRDGTRGDLFYRIMIRIPPSPDAIGLKERSQALEEYYGGSVRQTLPSTILEM